MRVLQKKLFRGMRKHWSQSLAVVMVVFCGIANYITVYSAYLNLKLTRDTYYARERLADFEIRLERAPVSAVYKVENLSGIRSARGRIVQDVNVDLEGVDEPRVGRVISMPVPRRPVLNDVILLAGRYFEGGAQDEVILSDRFATENGLAIGDRISINVENRKYSLKIVGRALSPEYIYMIRTVQELFPDPRKFGILWVPEDFAESALDMSAACNDIVGAVDDPEALDRILEEAEDLLEPYGVFAKTKQEDQLSARFLADEIRGLGVSAQIVPTLFLGIAALILLVLLSRMVRTERMQIGLMKAYGYSNFTVAFHYLEYGLILCAAGCFGGFFAGQWLSSLIMRMYVQFYQFPLLEARVHPEVLVRSMGITVICACTGAILAAVRAVRIHPADAMRPEPPRFAHKVWLERFPRLWRRFSFTWKMIFRNISRNSFRAGLNAAGVAISIALLVMGFFSLDAMYYALRFQFQEIQREDVRVSFQREFGKNTLYDMARFPSVRRAEPLLQYPFTITTDWRKKDIVVIGMPQDAELQKLMNFDGSTVPLGNRGLVLTKRLAEELGVGPGDEVTLKPLMGRITGEKEVTVERVSEQFLGTSAYMEIGRLSALLDQEFALNAALIRIEEDGAAAFNREVKDVAGIAAVGYNQDAYQSLMDTLAASMSITNTTIIIFAGIIAFAIIYNITAVALAERERELASLRVLGLTPSEVGNILYLENVALAVVGIFLGIPLGISICKLLVHAYSTDLYRLPYHVEDRTFVLATILSLGFVLAANLAIRRKILRLDLVEVLKTRE